MRFLRIGDASKEIGIGIGALRKWIDKDRIPHRISPGGQRLVDVDAYFEGKTKFGQENLEDKRESVFYCRVSSNHQKDDLKRQIDSAKSKFPNHKIIKDIGSGINWKRKGLLTLLEKLMRREIKEIVVFHKDRLARFGFELIEFIAETNDAKILVLDDDSGEKETVFKSAEQELAEDLMAIVTVFSCRQMGKRRYVRKNNMSELQIEENKDLSESEPEENTLDMDD